MEQSKARPLSGINVIDSGRYIADPRSRQDPCGSWCDRRAFRTSWWSALVQSGEWRAFETIVASASDIFTGVSQNCVDGYQPEFFAVAACPCIPGR